MAGPTFTCFPNFPLEIRRLIWRATLPGPRLVYAAPMRLKGGKCSRVWSDCANDDEGKMAFFDVNWNGEPTHVRDSQTPAGIVVESPELKPLVDFTDGHITESASLEAALDALEGMNRYTQVYSRSGPEQFFGLRSTQPPPITLLVCQESYQVALDEGYTQAFGSLGCQATTWFSYKHDTLYLDPETWGPGGDPEDLGNDYNLVQKLAVGHPIIDGLEWYGRRAGDAELLAWFGNVTEFTFVASFWNNRVEWNDCALMDLAAHLDLEDPRREMYHLGYNPEKEKELAPAIEKVKAKHLKLLEDDVRNMEAGRIRLREMIRVEVEKGNWKHPQMNVDFGQPKFSRLSLVPTANKAAFKQLEETYEKEKRAYWMKNSPEGCSISESGPAADIVVLNEMRLG